MRALTHASAISLASQSQGKRSARQRGMRDVGSLSLPKTAHRLRRRTSGQAAFGAPPLSLAVTAQASPTRSPKGGKRPAGAGSKPAAGAAGQALLSRLAGGQQGALVPLKEAQQALASAKGSPATLWSLYTALRGRVAGSLDARCDKDMMPERDCECTSRGSLTVRSRLHPRAGRTDSSSPAWRREAAGTL